MNGKINKKNTEKIKERFIKNRKNLQEKEFLIMLNGNLFQKRLIKKNIQIDIKWFLISFIWDLWKKNKSVIDSRFRKRNDGEIEEVITFSQKFKMIFLSYVHEYG